MNELFDTSDERPALSKDAFVGQFDFTGKKVAVTGAASGIGRAAALQFLALGADVIAADRDQAALAGLLEVAESPRLTTLVYDQARLDELDEFVSAMGELDIFINNAGVLLGQSLLDLDDATLQNVININLGGAIALTRRVGAGMVQRGQGVILHTGSQMSFTGAAQRGVYASTKAAIVQFVRTAAAEWAPHGVRVNGLAPGRTLTPINRRTLSTPEAVRESLAHIPMGRLGSVQDMSNGFVFLASDAAAYITGHTLLIDGGWVLA